MKWGGSAGLASVYSYRLDVFRPQSAREIRIRSVAPGRYHYRFVTKPVIVVAAVVVFIVIVVAVCALSSIGLVASGTLGGSASVT